MYSRLTSFIPTGYVDYKNINIQITNNKTLDKRNPPPLTVSCAPSGDEGPTVYIQTKEINKTKNQKPKQPVPRADNYPGGLSNIPPIRRTEIHIPIGVVERMSQRKTDGL
jgi:hypothetical protein